MRKQNTWVWLWLVVAGITATAAGGEIWSLNDDWQLDCTGAQFGSWRIAVGGTIAERPMGEDHCCDTTNYQPLVARGYADTGAIAFKFYESAGSTTPVEKTAGIPSGYDPNCGSADAGDVVVGANSVWGPKYHPFILWIAPRDMTISAYVNCYNVGTVGSQFHFLIRDGAGQPPLNPEGEQCALVDGYNSGTGRQYYSLSIAPFAVSAGQEVMFWQGEVPNGTIMKNLVGIEELTITEVPEPATMAILGLGGLLAVLRRKR